MDGKYLFIWMIEGLAVLVWTFLIADYECFSMKQHLGCFAFTFKFLLKYKCYANSLMSLLELILHEMKTPTTISECRAGKQTNIRYLFNLRYTV